MDAPQDRLPLPSLDDALAEMVVVEWSQTQNTLHIQTVAEMYDNNLEQFVRDQSLDYVVLGVFFDHDAASELAEQLGPAILARRSARRGGE